MVDRVSSASFHAQNLRHLSERFASLNELNRQISSGKRASSFVDLNGVVEQVSSFESKIKRNEAYIKNNNIIKTRLSAVNESLSRLQDVAQDVKSLVSRSDALSPGSTLGQNASAAIQSVLDQLNVDQAGRYLFSGSRTDVPPVANPPTIVTPGTADSSYYNGNSDVLTARVTDSLEIEYGITADDPAFQDLIAGINTAIEAANTNDPTMLATAGTLLDSAITGLAGVRAEVNSNLLIVENANSQIERVNLSFQEALSAEVDTDIAEATIKLSADEVVLQATFSAFARISYLKLSDFLN